MHIFLSTSFSGKVQPDRTVEPKFRTFIERILGTLRASGHRVFCAVEDENWVIADKDPPKAVLYDLEHLQANEVIVALVESQSISAGVQFELGMAYALKKQIIMVHAQDQALPFFNTGLKREPNISVIVYAEEAALLEQLSKV